MLILYYYQHTLSIYLQRNNESIIFVRTFSPDFSVMLPDYAVGDRQPQTVALTVVSCLIHAVEALEDILAFIL